MSDYDDFLDSKTHLGSMDGFDPVFMPDFLFDFQSFMVTKTILKGRFANFADCGLGKTPMQLVWAENIVRKTNKNVLILTPLAVSQQTIKESEKFGIESKRSNDGTVYKGITITNYEQLHKFNPNDFVGLVCDESSILKSFDGQTKTRITDFMKKMPYRLLMTATAAPNDFIELGTSSEALGYLGYMDMLNRFFKNDQNNSSLKGSHALNQVNRGATWRFKGHAEMQFWRWVCSWALAVRKPSDLGFDDSRFVLPVLTETEHLIEANTLPEGCLFAMPAIGLKEQREERRRTIQERCEKVAELVNDTGKPALVWCHLNTEGDKLENLIPDAIQVSGKDSDAAKEEKMITFSEGKARILITKPKIGALGLNFQHCSHQTFFPSHSYEQYYQGVRRSWRFGQKNPVHVDIVTTEGEKGVLRNLQRKSTQAEKMFANLVNEMNRSLSIDKQVRTTKKIGLPLWLK